MGYLRSSLQVAVRRDPEFFGDVEMDLLYIAKKLQESLRLEQVLTEAGIDYAVETDTYLGGVMFKRELMGAFFYVLPDRLETARAVIKAAGYEPQTAGA